MELQIIINILASLVIFFLGYAMKGLSDSMKDLQDADRKLAEKVAAIEILVAGDYVRRDEMEKALSAIFAKLEKISDKLDGKVDKGSH